MNFYCPQCGVMVAAADVNLGTNVAKCRQCQNVFSCAEVVRKEQGTPRMAPADNRSAHGPLQPRPSKMHIEEWAGVWSISWRWFSPVHIFLVFFCCIWDGVLIAFYAGVALF